MRAFVLMMIAVVLTATSAGADEVALEMAGGTYTVPVTINGAVKIKFTIDSGAADILIPADVALTLARSGTLAESDFIGNKTYSLADGSTLQSMNFYLREVRVGNLILKNVVASAGPVMSSPLLGQSFLSRIGAWTLDNNRHVIVFNPPPGQAAPQPMLPKERKWEDFTKAEIGNFLDQCYLSSRTAALRRHVSFCLYKYQEAYDSLVLIGNAIVFDSKQELKGSIQTQEISFRCSLNPAGKMELLIMRDSGSPYMIDWETVNKCAHPPFDDIPK